MMTASQAAAAPADQALPRLEVLTAENPDDLELRCDYARALAWSDRYPDADAQYSRVLSAQPHHREALLGLLRLRGYQGRPEDALKICDSGLLAYPGDKEFLAERVRLIDLLARKSCDRLYRYTARSTFENDAYSFAGPRVSAGLSLQDRRFHGWDAAAGFSYEHRFGLDDLDIGINAVHRLPWKGAYAGFSLGGATRHVILPAVRGSLLAGDYLGYGFSAEIGGSYRHYDLANSYGLAPSLSWDWNSWTATVGFPFSSTYYTDGVSSGWLASQAFKLQWSRWCRVKPWASYARSKEAFEPGAPGAVSNFSADHYAFGAAVRLLPGFDISPYYVYEWRTVSRQTIRGGGVGLAYSWGDLK
jgi:tetratricopeptide (TPR) repeat protein